MIFIGCPLKTVLVFDDSFTNEQIIGCIGIEFGLNWNKNRVWREEHGQIYGTALSEGIYF